MYEAEEALHRAVSAARIEWRVTGTGGALDWSPDGSKVVTEGLQSSGVIDIRDAATGESVRSFAASDGEVTDVTYAPTGTLLGTTSAAGIAAVWDSTTGELLHDIGVPGGAPAWGPSFSPDGQLFAAAWPHDGDGLVRIMRVSTGEIVHELRGVPGAEGTSFSPDGTRLAVSSVTEPIAVIIDVESGVELLTLDGNPPILTDVAWSPDGALVATTGDAGPRSSTRHPVDKRWCSPATGPSARPSTGAPTRPGWPPPAPTARRRSGASSKAMGADDHPVGHRHSQRRR